MKFHSFFNEFEGYMGECEPDITKASTLLKGTRLRDNVKVNVCDGVALATVVGLHIALLRIG